MTFPLAGQREIVPCPDAREWRALIDQKKGYPGRALLWNYKVVFLAIKPLHLLGIGVK